MPWARSLSSQTTRISIYKEVFYKEGSTRLGKNLRNSSTGSETNKESDFIKNDEVL